MPFKTLPSNNPNAVETLPSHYSDQVIDLNQFDALISALKENQTALANTERFNLLMIVKRHQQYALLEILNASQAIQVTLYTYEQNTHYDNARFKTGLSDTLHNHLTSQSEKKVEIKISHIPPLAVYSLLMESGLNNRRITNASNLTITDHPNPTPTHPTWQEILKVMLIAALATTFMVAFTLNFMVPGLLWALMVAFKLGSIATTFLFSTGCGIIGGTAMGGVTIWATHCKAKQKDSVAEAFEVKPSPNLAAS